MRFLSLLGVEGGVSVRVQSRTNMKKSESCEKACEKLDSQLSGRLSADVHSEPCSVSWQILLKHASRTDERLDSSFPALFLNALYNTNADDQPWPDENEVALDVRRWDRTRISRDFRPPAQPTPLNCRFTAHCHDFVRHPPRCVSQHRDVNTF